MTTPFFGIGAMRAGTSWLGNLLNGYPDCSVPVKELHFFDSRYGKANGARVPRSKAKKLVRHSQKVLEGIKAASKATKADDDDDDDNSDETIFAQSEWPVSAEKVRVAWTDEVRAGFFSRADIDQHLRSIADLADFLAVRDISSYVAFMRRQAGDAAAFGEITPSYALLPAEAYAEMDRVFQGARFIFIMRDPVDRLWSHVRYMAKRRAPRGVEASDLNLSFCRALQTPSYVLRSSYRHTVAALESVIPAERILYLFYETLTSTDTGSDEVKRIEAALGLRPRVSDPEVFQTARNVSPDAILDTESERAALKLFEPEYRFAAQRFVLPEKWRRPLSSK
jgi:hypothetical protein